MQADTVFIYSSIVFSIVSFVLGGMTFTFFGMRLLAGRETGGSTSSTEVQNVVPAEKAAESQPAGDVKSQHVAAITAAILAATGGQGRVLSVTPVRRVISSESTKMWKTAAVMATADRRLAPSWKR